MSYSKEMMAVVILGLTVGCGQMSPQPIGEPPAAETETDAEEMVSTETDDATAQDDATETTLDGGLTKRAFLSANERVTQIMTEIIKTLDGVTDEASAETAAPKLAELTPEWKSAATAATAAYLALDDEVEDEVYREAMQGAQAKRGEVKLTHKPDLISQIQRVAKIGGPAIEQQLIALRDAFLTTRGIYSPTRAREHMAEKLGSEGSPLKE